MRRRRSSSGFSLIELLIATGLSSLVLLGVIEIATSMVKTEVAGERSGTVTAWSLISINAMNATISGAGAVGLPAAGGAAPGNSADQLVVCTNWSDVDSKPETGVNFTADYFCYDSNTLFHVGPWPITYAGTAATSCPTSISPACTWANWKSNSKTTAVATGVYPNGGNNVFTLDSNDILNKTVIVQYTVGRAQAGTYAGGGSANLAIAQYTTYNTKILLEN